MKWYKTEQVHNERNSSIVITTKLADLSVTHQETFQPPLKKNRETLLAPEELHLIKALKASCSRNLQS